IAMEGLLVAEGFPPPRLRGLLWADTGPVRVGAHPLGQVPGAVGQLGKYLHIHGLLLSLADASGQNARHRGVSTGARCAPGEGPGCTPRGEPDLAASADEGAALDGQSAGPAAGLCVDLGALRDERLDGQIIGDGPGRVRFGAL